ncbi:21565_t:CDS:2 [Cetraspora pellucida]|uniref:21565_t:CDS:1 n=1 Tax=Cetraspora pellucida TaxID=1433469 RepID=A0A9N9FQ06_9GLOM|nr:21565_t:CDS:2 [Cetraspora pellucida]
MQSIQQVEGTNGLIKTEYKNTLPTQRFSSIQNVFFEPVQNEIKKYLTLESTLVQSIQISQSILYHAYSFELTLLLAAHKYTDGYLEDEYDALQASLENLLNIVNHNTHLCTCLYIISNGFYCRHFFSVFKISRNAKFDIKLISKCWYTDLMQASDYSMIEGIVIEKIDSNKQINQLISIHGPNIYQASIHTSIIQKQEYAYDFEKFIENHTDIDANNRMTIEVTQIENSKKLKHKGHPKILKSTQII